MPITEDDILEGNNQIAAAILLAGKAIAYEIKYLGNGNASTEFGALEALGMHLTEKLASCASSISEIAAAIEAAGGERS